MTFDTWKQKPPADLIGWCHSCERVQFGLEAQWVQLTWGTWAWGCAECMYEPWDPGIWRCSCDECVEYDDEGRPMWGSPDPPEGFPKCWQAALFECAEAGCTTYLFDCDHFDQGAPVG